MKFLLITSFCKELVKVWVCQETSPAGSLLPPVDLASVASVIRQKGHEAKIIDLRLFKRPLDKYTEEVKKFKPDFVISNLSTTSANYDYELIAATPNNIKKICFGTHAQSLPEECFRKGVDYILRGDPEAALLSLLENNLDGTGSRGVLTIQNLKKVPYYWENLDTMPFPSLDLLDMHRYYAPYVRRGNLFTLVLGSRGCSYKCTYCLYPVLFGNKFRLRSESNIVDEIEECYRKFDIKEFYFLDATFNFSKKRIEDFCKELMKRNLKVRWSCNMRVSPVSLDMLRLMKEAGCSKIFYGVEDQDFLNETNKGITKELTIEAFRQTKEAGISTVAFIMLFPRDDIKEKVYVRNIVSTLNILKTDAFQCNVAIPFPGTEMFNMVRGEKDVENDWSYYDPHGKILPYKSKLDLIKVKRTIYRKYLFLNPWAVIKVLADINFRACKAIVTTFLKQNIMPSLFILRKRV